MIACRVCKKKKYSRLDTQKFIPLPLIIFLIGIVPIKDKEDESGSQDEEESICGLEEFLEEAALEKIFSKVLHL